MPFVQRDLFGEDLQGAIEFLLYNFHDKEKSCLPSEAVFDLDNRGLVEECCNIWPGILFTEIPLDREARIELEGRFSGEEDAFYVGICRPCVRKEEVYRRVTYEECTFPERFSIKQGIWIPRVFEEAQARGFTR